MNSQERDALNLFLEQMVQARPGPKDQEAETLIRSAMEKQPDSGYLLVQRAMQFDLLLQQAQSRMTDMQAEIDQLKKKIDKPVDKSAETSFLGDVHAWGRTSPTGPTSVVASSGSTSSGSGMVPSASATGPAPVNQTLRASGAAAATAPSAPSAPSAQPAPAPVSAPSTWGSGFLGSVATTAAGVVAGSFLYHGIQNLMSSNHGASASNASNASNASPGGRESSGGTDWDQSVAPSSGHVYTAYVDNDVVDESGSDMDGGFGDGGDGE